ncbi:response regulator transcription factor [Capnocytophaga catalasegens]|uniref:Phosphate regulon transcriptional regulatory protein PhoB n=1 Tax=Capnocytophaga catalasegens TaxID=1004260 RepID=A0AAV5AYV9_9FLAO|nr:response regulator transcription factor [Capnocytophaga catalasegens]GIZ16478.1 DNA-binding response regulator [Capnocytophaga catalasegens]GJM50283.1 DNA-binding response regulator [Capnocytophaga catalasegens]GJM53800.1 DNA-binding response regulator [Capnocytophaga catalasegens]
MKNKDIKILLVDDEKDIVELIEYNLQREGFQILTASNGKQAIKVAQKELPHLILMDIMMPELDGIEACTQLRSIPALSDTIIAFLTARSEDYSQLAGFEAGADDYITKPIKPKVLVSKVKALLRRVLSVDKNQLDVQQIGDFRIHFDEYKVEIQGKEVLFPRKEFDLLALLASKPGKVFKREEILENVWGNEVVVGDRTIDVHIRRLREKLGDMYFKTLKGVGYKFVP